MVAGGGKVAARKVLSLLMAGALVKVVSPELGFRLTQLNENNKISAIKRKIRKSDLVNAALVISATDDNFVNQKVSIWAKEMNILVNVVDNSNLSTFISPAVLPKAKALVAIYTDGRDPVLSRDLKNFIKEHWDEFISYRDRLPKG